MTKGLNYQDYLIRSLKNQHEAAGYLNAALEGGNIEVFLLALYHVVQAQGGMAKIAQKLHKSRTSLYKSLSMNGNPYFKNTQEILSAVGMQLTVVTHNRAK
jgi:probable addiction module antidote protein